MGRRLLSRLHWSSFASAFLNPKKALMAQVAPSVAILGGGINGAALARELVLSGVDVVVVEADDLACGATAWSTRLVHGGLRYLEYGEIDLVRESLTERERLVTLAAHLVEPLTFAIPLERRTGGMLAAAARLLGASRLARWLAGGRSRGSWTVGVGLTLYDLLSGRRWPRHRMHRGGAPGLPEVDASRYPWAATYVDAQMLFPERFTVELLQDARQIAAERGCSFRVLTHRSVTADGDGTLHVMPNGNAVAAGESETVVWRPEAIVNASGAWVDRTRASLPWGAEEPQLIGGTKGSHLVLDSPLLRAQLHDSGVYAEAADGRPIFVLPFGEQLVLVGTTDLPSTGDPADAVASEEEIAYLLDACGQLFPTAAPGREHLLLHYCGVRPLPHAGQGTNPAAVTRRHLLVRHAGTAVPSWSIVGGKLTTCRSLAESAAREVLAAIGWPVRETSASRPLPGLAAAEDAAARHQLREELQAGGLSAAGALRAVRLYGGGARGLLARDPRGPSLGPCGLTAEAVLRAVEQEWAVTLDDVVSRRLMLSFDPAFDLPTLRAIASVLASAGFLAEDQREDEVAQVVAGFRRRHGRQLRESTPSSGKGSGQA